MRASQGHNLSDVSAFNAACVSVSVSANRDDGEMQKTGKQVSALKLLVAVSCHVIYLEVSRSFYFIEMTVISMALAKVVTECMAQH